MCRKVVFVVIVLMACRAELLDKGRCWLLILLGIKISFSDCPIVSGDIDWIKRQGSNKLLFLNPFFSKAFT